MSIRTLSCWFLGHDWMSAADLIALDPKMRTKPIVSRCIFCGRSKARNEEERQAEERWNASSAQERWA